MLTAARLGSCFWAPGWRHSPGSGLWGPCSGEGSGFLLKPRGTSCHVPRLPLRLLSTPEHHARGCAGWRVRGDVGGSWAGTGRHTEPSRATHLHARTQDGDSRAAGQAPGASLCHQPWRGSRARALSVPPRCAAGRQPGVDGAVTFSTAGLWRTSPARPRRGAELFTALPAARVTWHPWHSKWRAHGCPGCSRLAP